MRPAFMLLGTSGEPLLAAFRIESTASAARKMAAVGHQRVVGARVDAERLEAVGRHLRGRPAAVAVVVVVELVLVDALRARDVAERGELRQRKRELRRQTSKQA